MIHWTGPGLAWPGLTGWAWDCFCVRFLAGVGHLRFDGTQLSASKIIDLKRACLGLEKLSVGEHSRDPLNGGKAKQEPVEEINPERQLRRISKRCHKSRAQYQFEVRVSRNGHAALALGSCTLLQTHRRQSACGLILGKLDIANPTGRIN